MCLNKAVFRPLQPDLGGWNTGMVTSMVGMFENARWFQSDLQTWDTGRVNNMNSMFKNAISFESNLTR